MPTEDEELEFRVLILAPTGRDALLAAGVLEESGVLTRRCGDVEELRRELADGAGAVLLTEEALTPETARALAEIFQSQLPWSDLPLLVFSGGAVKRETLTRPLSEISELANVTLLERPTRKVTLVSAVRAALRARRRQYEVRDLLSQLEVNVRERDQFLAMLSHELRNPLAAILAASQLMERRKSGDHDRERSIVERQVLLLTRLVDDLLDVSRITKGKITLERVPLDVAEIVGRVVESLAASASAHEVRVVVDGGDEPFRIEGDHYRVEQIVNNLLTNAIKYTPTGGEIRISLVRDEGVGEIRVIDSGMGIDPDVLPRIFEPFAQADHTIDRSRGGLGLGLTLVRDLVRLHGGTVSAASEGRGKGSTFVVQFPLTETPLPAADAAAPAEPPRPAFGRRVLVIEDNADLRALVAELLRDAGYDVLDAPDGEAGVAAALRVRPDVALVDIGLPRLDGYGVARRLRHLLPHSLFLVALTGYGSGEDRRRAFAAGFDDHLTKPITRLSLLDMLGRQESRGWRAASAG